MATQPDDNNHNPVDILLNEPSNKPSHEIDHKPDFGQRTSEFHDDDPDKNFRPVDSDKLIKGVIVGGNEVGSCPPSSPHGLQHVLLHAV
jgi:hypothetical protein